MSLVLALVGAAGGSRAEAAVGERHLVAQQPSAEARNKDHSPTLRITVWYPAAAEAPQTSIDLPPAAPLLTVGSVAMNAPFADEAHHPIILLSHGFGGTARVMGWFGLSLVEQGYVVVAVDHPGNNGMDPMTPAGAVLWWDRADDLKVALSAVLADDAFNSHIDPAKLGIAGFSIGGLTALVGGGAQTDWRRMASFCAHHPGDGTCKPQLEFPLDVNQAASVLNDPALATERAKENANHAIFGVKAIFAMAPVVQPLKPETLKTMKIPVAIVVGADDITVPANTHARVAYRLLPSATLKLIPGVTHYSFLSTCTKAGRSTIEVCKQATKQDEAHHIAIVTALSLFNDALR